MNEDIRDKEVRLIGEDGEQLGVVSLKDALDLATEKKLDLVKIAATAQPPVCKLMDYGKHKYEQQKREKEAKKKQKTTELKEVRLSLNIEKHDMDTKSKMAKKFLESGDKVKVSLRFKGRELGHADLGKKVFMAFAEEVAEYGKMEKMPALEGRSMIAIFQPLK